jgi:predicted metal-dependent phosphoesterase TrpH
VAGIPPAQEEAKSFPGLLFIPGVEIATLVPDGEVHILGYFLDPSHPGLSSTLERLQHSRVERARKIVEKLKALGLPLSWERILELSKGESLGRPHIAQAMAEKGYVPDLREAFLQYIGRGKPAYVERDHLSPEEGVRLIRIAGGLPVLAHPLDIGARPVEPIARRLKRQGLVGMEAYYGGYTPEKVAYLAGLSRKLRLIPLGGSDYHGLEKGVDTPLGSLDLPREAVERLLALAPRPLKVR